MGGQSARRATVAAVAGLLLGLATPASGAAAAASPRATAHLVHAKTRPFFHQQAVTTGSDRLSIQGRVSTPAAASAAPLGGTWSSLGPTYISGLDSYGPVAGRVTALAARGSIVYAGAADGGVWRSANGGATWSQPTTDAQPTLAIGALAVDWTTTPETVYAGTGEGNLCQDCLPGQGVLKSGDGGQTWTLYGQAQLGGAYLTGLAVTGTTVVAATSEGLYVSTTSGTSWPATPTVAGHFDALYQDPTTPTKFWAASTPSCISNPGSGVIGVLDTAPPAPATSPTWTPMWSGTNPAPPRSVIRIGLGVGAGHTVYAALAACGTAPGAPPPTWGDGQLEEILKLPNGTGAWQTITPTAPPNLVDYFSVDGSGEFQGWYDNVIAVDPYDATDATAVFSGVTMLATRDGGQTFTDIANPYSGGSVHPDVHALAFTGAGTFYAGDDGGVSFTADLGGKGTSADWFDRSTGLAITQFYQGTSLDLTHFAGGSQDNGTAGNPQGATPAPWLSLLDGDGGWTAMIPGSSTLFGAAGGGDIFQFDYSGAGGRIEVAPCPSTNLNDPSCTQPTGFVAPFVLDPTSTTANTARLYAATNHVYRTTTGGLPAGGTGAGAAWSSISGDLTTGAGSPTTHPSDFIHTMAIGSSKFNGSLLTGSDFGKVFLTNNATASPPNWADVTGNLPSWTQAASTGNAWITGLALNPLDSTEAWVTIGAGSGQRIFHTTSVSSGVWSDISTTLPASLVVDGIAVDPLIPQNVYIGTDAGTLVCTACGTASPVPSWVPLGTGLPNVRVDALSITSDDAHLVAWTHGRGAFVIPRPYPTKGADLQPPSIDFGSQPLGSTSAVKTATLTNDGTAPLTIGTFTVSGDFVLDQAAAPPNACTTGPLAPGASCNFGIRFQPRGTGTRSGNLTVTDDAANSPQTTSLSGNGTPVPWRSLSGYITSSPQIAASGMSQTDLFVRGSDNGLWHRSFNGSTWGNWEALGGVMNSDPAVVASGGHIDVFTRGTDNHLWQMTYDGTKWMPWRQVDSTGIITSTPTACSPSAGRFDIFVRGTDNELWHKIINNGVGTSFTNSDGAGGILDSEPSCASWGSNRMDVFIRGTDKQLWHLWTSDATTWHTWTRVGNGVLGSRPSATTWGPNRLDVYITGSDSRLWHIATNDATNWSNWSDSEANGGLLASPPGASARGQGVIDIVIRGTDNAVWYETVSGS